jgi:protein-tyrosine phosphatase
VELSVDHAGRPGGDPLPERRIVLGAVLNFRDLGGYETAAGGETRWRAVFRSDSLHKVATAQPGAFESVGIRSVYDLRSGIERELKPSLASSTHLPLKMKAPTEGLATTLRSRADGERWLSEEYLYMLVNTAPDFGALFSMIAEPESRPAVFHCAGGKDRTGLAAALLLTCLGVDRETVLDDYELTSHYVKDDDLAEVLEVFCMAGMARPAAEGVLSTPRWAMAAALDELGESFGGIDTYLLTQAGLPAADLAALRGQLVV